MRKYGMKLDENNLWHYCTANTRTSYQMTPVSSAPNMKWYQNTQVICFEAVVWYKSVHMFMHNFVHTFIWFGRGRGGGGRGYCYYSTAAGGTYCDLLQIELIAVDFFLHFGWCVSLSLQTKYTCIVLYFETAVSEPDYWSLFIIFKNIWSKKINIFFIKCISSIVLTPHLSFHFHLSKAERTTNYSETCCY